MHRTLIIFDSEFTAWPGSAECGWSRDWEHREIIQLAAIKVRVSQSGVVVQESFNELIKPNKNPFLSDYIVDLTGISQSMVDEMGIDFPSALKAFYQFAELGALPCMSWGHDERVLAENCRLHGLSMPHFDAGFFDLRQYSMELGLVTPASSSGELASNLGLNLSGHPHNALFDVRSIALALNFWLERKQMSLRNMLENPVHKG